MSNVGWFNKESAQWRGVCPLDGSGPEGLHSCPLDESKMDARDRALTLVHFFVAFFRMAFFLCEIFVYYQFLCVARVGTLFLMDVVISGFVYYYTPYQNMYSRTEYAKRWVAYYYNVWMTDLSTTAQGTLMNNISSSMAMLQVVKSFVFSCMMQAIFGTGPMFNWWILQIVKYMDEKVSYFVQTYIQPYFRESRIMDDVPTTNSKVTCPICLQNETNTLASCGHTFCGSCMDACVETSTKCPICRANIKFCLDLYHPG